MNPRVKTIKPGENFTLEITFTNGEKGVYDCKPLLEFRIFQELQEPNYFQRAKVAHGTVTWPHNQDIYPDTLYVDSKKAPLPEKSEVLDSEQRLNS